MAIDFRLTTEQQNLRETARDFAHNVLAPLVPDADAARDPHEAFAKTKPAYVEFYKLGFAMGFLPKEYGGGSVSNLDLQLVAEEICAVDPGFATTLLVNGLGLMNVAWFGTDAEKEKWLRPACTDPKGEYLAGWVVSEAGGRPGGTANFDAPQPSPVSIGLTAELTNGEYVLNGRKYWPCNAGGWDKQGADVNVCIVRTDKTKGGKEGLSAIMVPRGAPGFRVEKVIDTMGHRLCQNNSLVFDNVRVPEEHHFRHEGQRRPRHQQGLHMVGPGRGDRRSRCRQSGLRIHPRMGQGSHGRWCSADHATPACGLSAVGCGYEDRGCALSLLEIGPIPRSL